MSFNRKRVRFGAASSKGLLMPFVSRQMVLLTLGAGLICAPIRAQTVPANAVLSFPLTFDAKGTPFSIAVGRQEVKFRKEPDFGKDKVVRRALSVGPDKSDFIGFAADLTRKTLYLPTRWV